MADEDFVFYIHAGADERMARNLASRSDFRVALHFDKGASRLSSPISQPYRFTNGASRTFFAQPYIFSHADEAGQLGAYVIAAHQSWLPIGTI